MIDKRDRIEYEKCFICGRTVQERLVGHDYHKGFYTIKRNTVYSFEEKRFDFPEGSRRVDVCFDCLDDVKKQKEAVKKLRLKKIEEHTQRLERQVEWDEKKIKSAIKHKEKNLITIRKMVEYHSAVVDGRTPRHHWDSLKVEKD